MRNAFTPTQRDEERLAIVKRMEDQAATVMTILAKITAGDLPKAGKCPCPACKTGTLHWRWSGPRAFSMRCETLNCVQAIG